MKNETGDAYITKTPQEEIELCEHCPYPRPICGDKGCTYFRKRKAELRKNVWRKRRHVGEINYTD